MSGFLGVLWANRTAILLALLFGLVWKWHSDQVDNAVDVATTELQGKAEIKARDDLIAAQGQWIANTSLLSTLAAADDALLLQRLASIETAMRKFKPEYRNHATTAPLPVDCVADPERLRVVNAALGH